MELRDFFAGNWRALVLVPAVTAIIAGALFVTSVDERYEASGVVSIAEFLGGGTPAEVGAAIDDFDSSLQNRQVLTIVAEQSPSSETFRIETETIGNGGDVRVSLESATQASAEGALDAGVREALILLSESVGRQTGRQLVAADAVAADASRDLQDIEAAAGAADLEAELARRSGDLLALRNQIAAAAGNALVQNELEATLVEKQQEIDEIEAQLLAWTNARARFDLAVTAGADASLALQGIETTEVDLETQPLIQSLRSDEVSSVPDLLRVVVAATAVTAGAVVLIALLLGSGRRRRQPARISTGSSDGRRSRSDTPSGGVAVLDPLDDEAASWTDDDAWGRLGAAGADGDSEHDEDDSDSDSGSDEYEDEDETVSRARRR